MRHTSIRHRQSHSRLSRRSTRAYIERIGNDKRASVHKPAVIHSSSTPMASRRSNEEGCPLRVDLAMYLTCGCTHSVVRSFFKFERRTQGSIVLRPIIMVMAESTRVGIAFDCD